MNKYIIQGGHPLSGVVTVSGAKNAAVAILPAALLVNGTCRIENVPDISDVRLLLEILDSMGAKIRRLSPNTLEDVYKRQTYHFAVSAIPLVLT